MNTYSIAHLAAIAYLNSKGLKAEGACKYVCDEGTADVVVKDGEVTVLVIVTAKRQRGEVKEPEFDYPLNAVFESLRGEIRRSEVRRNG